MAKPSTFQCSVITPERPVLECEATFVSFPAHDGEIGALVNRGPLVCKLGIGALRVESPSGKHEIFVDGGFAQLADNHLTILTEQAKKSGEIDAVAVNQTMVEARAMATPTIEAVEARSDAIKRAQVQLKIARS
jgi:F-type H+-transporting ATPase subunit epsilon